MESGRRTGARRYGPVLIFLMLGTLAGAWHERVTDRGHPDIVAGAVRTVVAPPAGVLTHVSRWISDQVGWITHGRALADENRQLTLRVAELEKANASLQEAQIANDHLRADLGFVAKQTPRPLGAEVLERRTNPNFDTILISRGSRDGVCPHSVVVTRNGLVGQVWEVSPTTSSVVLLTDQQYGAVGGRVQRANSRAEGVCRGDSALITMIDLRNDADVKPGDLIVTSGYSIFPRGLPIGKVKEIKSDEGGVTKTATLKPAVDFTRLEEVYILLPPTHDSH